MKTFLIILDGWGIAEDPAVSAVDRAELPYYRSLLQKYPHISLRASEEAVGLPTGQMGNSEVGHLNLGAGRIVPQELMRIQNEIETRKLKSNSVYRSMTEYLVSEKKALHLIGLVSDGGVHSSLNHLTEFIKMFSEENINVPVFIHAFTDGRDTGPKSAEKFLNVLSEVCAETGCGKVISLVGRYYAMDRNKKYERTQIAFELLTQVKGKTFPHYSEALATSYAHNITDEFLEPVVLPHFQRVTDGDVVLNFNFRTDRGRQITELLHPLPVKLFTFTRYDETYDNVAVFFEKENLQNTLGEVLSRSGKTQLRIAETEKYPHVTYFFNGGREEPFPGEERILCPSPAVATYDLRPEMSAFELRDTISAVWKREKLPDFICLNFANADMVGHTGIMTAAVKAVETVDLCLSTMVPEALDAGYFILILADHGNADRMLNPDGSAHTAHTLAKVPCLAVFPEGKEVYFLKEEGVLGDAAPTLLYLAGEGIPSEMTGEVLVAKHSGETKV